MFAVCCNSCGRAGNTRYGGNSMIVDPWGETLVSANGEEEIITAECNVDVLSDIRSSINVFADRRAEIYKL
ncbi:MAG: carbon-nitrogen family hydrolase, partial [Clostridia bacterium]|nr:carbon-nitrogen family hydrolase [Clostridia bacterium]